MDVLDSIIGSFDVVDQKDPKGDTMQHEKLNPL